MAESDFAKVIAVAAELAGDYDRGLGDLDIETIRNQMNTRDVGEKHLADVALLANAFANFGMNIRAAMKKNRRIIRVVGESDLPD